MASSLSNEVDLSFSLFPSSCMAHQFPIHRDNQQRGINGATPISNTELQQQHATTLNSNIMHQFPACRDNQRRGHNGATSIPNIELHQQYPPTSNTNSMHHIPTERDNQQRAINGETLNSNNSFHHYPTNRDNQHPDSQTNSSSMSLIMTDFMTESYNQAVVSQVTSSINGGQPQEDGEQHSCITSSRGHKVLTSEEREDVVNALLSKQQNHKLPAGTINEVAASFGVSRWTIQRIWKKVKQLLSTNRRVVVTCKFKEKCGRKKTSIDYDRITSIPLKQRTTIRSLAAAMGMSKSTVHRFVKWGKIKRHSNAMKPALTPLNTLQRLRWCVQNIIPQSIRTIPRFKNMYNMVHVDEKWFFMSKATQNFYLAPNEMKPYRSCKSKRWINKCMFLVAVSRSIFNEEGDNTFDGKIGVFPLTYKVAAQRSSVNRPADTLETKPIPKITKEVMRKVFVEQLIPAIKAKWPIDACGTIWVQQDNATPHMRITDQAFQEAGNTDGFHIHLLPQPPNSPDMNVLDLGFLRSIQSIQHQTMPRNIDELVDAVQHAFDVFDPKLLDYVFLSYQYCMLECMKAKGSNNYTLPHCGKAKMDRLGVLPSCVEVPIDLLSECASEMIRQYMALNEQEHPEEAQGNDNAAETSEGEVADDEMDSDDNIREYYTNAEQVEPHITTSPTSENGVQQLADETPTMFHFI